MEAGEKLGFLPGSMQDKVNPYLRPLLDALHDMMDFEQVTRFMAVDLIEIVPLAFMRGRTLNDACIILDEAQNTTRSQMLMFLTRLGHGGKMIITGDTTQIDLPDPRDSGLIDAVQRLRRVRGVAITTLNGSDIVRHELVQRIVEAYGTPRIDPQVEAMLAGETKPTAAMARARPPRSEPGLRTRAAGPAPAGPPHGRPTDPKEARKHPDRRRRVRSRACGCTSRGTARREPRPKSSAPRTSAARRREARRQMPDRFASLWAWLAWFRHRHVVTAACFVLLFTLVGRPARPLSALRPGPPRRRGAWTTPASPASASPP